MAIGANRTCIVLEVHVRTVSDSVMVMRLESWPCHGKFFDFSVEVVTENENFGGIFGWLVLYISCICLEGST